MDDFIEMAHELFQYHKRERIGAPALIILQSVAVPCLPVATPSLGDRTTGHRSAAIASPAPTSAACPQLSRLSCWLTPRRRGGRERKWALRLMMSLRLLMMTLRLMMSLRLMMIGYIRLRGDGVSDVLPCHRYAGG